MEVLKIIESDIDWLRINVTESQNISISQKPPQKPETFDSSGQTQKEVANIVSIGLYILSLELSMSKVQIKKYTMLLHMNIFYIVSVNTCISLCMSDVILWLRNYTQFVSSW